MKRNLRVLLCFLVFVDKLLFAQLQSGDYVSVPDGMFMNPVMGGYWADPSIVRDGDDYYLTTSSHPLYPGMTIFHSTNLVNWTPISYVLDKYYGVVLAPDMIKYKDKYFIYFSVNARRDWNNPREGNETYVTWAFRPEGPWSEPKKFNISPRLFDPGHLTDENGDRWLYFAKGIVLKLTRDGLDVIGEPMGVYEGWKYPVDWIDQSFALEGPKFKKIGKYYFMLVAEGGSHGPPTSHMVVVARSESPVGPWINSQYNPMVRTWKNSDRWWSKGHGTLVDTPKGDWYIIYHAYENGFYTLGRQVLIEPVEWTSDGWPVLKKGSNPEKAIRMPISGKKQKLYVMDLSAFRIGLDWWFYHELDHNRYSVTDRILTLKSEGTSPANSHPLLFNAGAHAYSVEVEIERDLSADAGLIAFYDETIYAGMGVKNGKLNYYSNGGEGLQSSSVIIGERLFLKLHNDRNFITMFYSLDGKTWIKAPWRTVDANSFNQNVYSKSQALMPGIYSAGKGEVKFKNVRYSIID